ncbi:MAG TPA: hypothetical protein VK602_19025 [Phyllobacterium sp.]|nr:hypothetical protein [Phyllobacterium sp.]
MTWGGAQWLVIFFIVLRALIGAAKANGSITFVPRPQTPAQQYFGQRIGDAILLAVLWWGGFFS